MASVISFGAVADIRNEDARERAVVPPICGTGSYCPASPGLQVAGAPGPAAETNAPLRRTWESLRGMAVETCLFMLLSSQNSDSLSTE
jgi:hypothetical protein